MVINRSMDSTATRTLRMPIASNMMRPVEIASSVAAIASTSDAPGRVPGLTKLVQVFLERILNAGKRTHAGDADDDRQQENQQHEEVRLIRLAAEAEAGE